MYNIYNKSNVFYMIDLETNSQYLIGDKDDLIKFLSDTCYRSYKPIRSFEKFIENNSILNNLNMGNDYNRSFLISRRLTEFDTFYYDVVKNVWAKRYMFIDGENRTVDVRLFLDEIMNYFNNHEKSYEGFYGRDEYWHAYIPSVRQARRNRYSKRQRTRSHSFWWGHGSTRPRIKAVKTWDSIIKTDEELKEYNLKPIEDSNNPLPVWWDDKARRCEGNWKSQYKTRRQHDIHSRYKTDIRKNVYIEEFSDEDINAMLEEDFINNWN